jgi:hypothetical protein
MKSINILAASLLITCFSQAQDYNFSHFNEVYTEFDDGIAIDYDSICNEGEIVLFPIGFTFPYFNYSFDKIFAHNLFLYSKTSISTNPIEHITAQLVPFAGAANCNRDSNNNSTVTYKTLGNIGNRICKIQWKNLKFNNSANEGDYINYQVWLYEDGTIEFRLGGILASSDLCYWDEENGLISSLILYDEIAQDPLSRSLSLFGDPNNPVVRNGLNIYTLEGQPDSSMVYRFGNLRANTKELKALRKIEVFPVPAIDKIQINSENEIIEVKIKDMTGKTLSIHRNMNVLDVSNLSGGRYVLEIKDVYQNVDTKVFIKF